MTDRTNLFEDDLDAMVEELQASLAQVPEARVPLDSVKLDPAEKMQRYVAIRENPEAWRAMLKEKGYVETSRYARSLEARYRKERGE